MIHETAMTAPSRNRAEGGLLTARVVSVIEDKLTVRTDGVAMAARKAFGCLVRPEPGDRVLCAFDESETLYVLSVLDRPGSNDMTIEAPGHARVLAREGDLDLASGRSVRMACADKMSFVSDTEVHKNRETVLSCEDLTATGKNARASFKSLSLVADIMSTMAKHAIQKAVSYVRHSEGHDRVAAGQMTRSADGLYSVDSRHTVMQSKKATKIDGERIFMG